MQMWADYTVPDFLLSPLGTALDSQLPSDHFCKILQ